MDPTERERESNKMTRFLRSRRSRSFAGKENHARPYTKTTFQFLSSESNLEA